VPDNQISAVINSLDSMAVINRASAFGNFSNPVKLSEAMSCQIPVVATETPATRWILRNRPECLVAAESVADLSEGIRKSLSIGRIDYGPQPNWNTNASLLEIALGQASADLRSNK
jgi:glycosyltransferase involved in cell wall biosynthesis